LVERRVHPRYQVELQVLCTSELRTMQVASQDVSLGGVFLRTTKPEPPGTAVSLAMRLPDGQALAVAGQVVHMLRGVGMGVEFARFSDGGKERLARFLRSFRKTSLAAPVVAEDRRGHRRVQLEAAVHLESASNFYTGFTRDVSEGGVFVATEAVLPLGTAVDVRFSLPDGGAPIAVRAEVRWQRVLGAGADAPAGLGLRFVTLPPADQKRIEAFVAQRDSMFYDDE
jgi:uncharacterized protein (TIGR02266 family)